MTDTQAWHGFCFCGTPLVSVPEIGPYCPSNDCDILDGPFDGSPRLLHTQQTAQIAKDQARIEQLEALLTEAATELEDDAIGRVTPRKHYPTEAVRYARDMDLPNRIRAALNPEETK